jgi:Flp pilus assembly protein TadB
MTQRSRRRTPFWFLFYTAVLLVIAGVSIYSNQWSVALTTLAIAAIFAWFTLRLWRKR